MKFFGFFIAFCSVLISCDSKVIVNVPQNETQFFTKDQNSALSELLSKSLLSTLLKVNLSDACRKDVEASIQSSHRGELWALKMFDASAKLPSGILNGNINQYGDFDQCLQVKSGSETDFRGQYCLTTVQLSLPKKEEYMNMLRKLVMSHEPYESDFDDTRIFVPKTSEIHWGSCVPSTCSNKEVSEAMKAHLVETFGIPDFYWQVKAKEKMCQVKDERWIENMEVKVIVAFGVLASLVVITILSTIYDSLEIELKNQWLTLFSIKRNYKQIFLINSSRNDISSIHVIRFFILLALLISHKSMQLNFQPITNRTDMNSYFLGSISILFRSCYLFTDLFLMLSGVLLSYSFIGKLQRGQKINVVEEILSRYFRFMPPMAALIFFLTLIMPQIGRGPQWNMIIVHQSEICRETWWRSFLMIHNFIGLENICSPNTHHVATDFQLFVVVAFFINFIHRYPKKGSTVVVILASLSTAARFYTVYTNELYIYITHGVKISKMFESSDLMYTITPYRFTVYSIGVLLGLCLQKYKTMNFSDRFIYIGWITATICFFATIVMCIESQAYHTAFFASFSPITVCLFFAWIIFYAQLIHKQKRSNSRIIDFFFQAFEWKFFKIVSNFSYCIYLLQFTVFHYNIGVTRSPSYYSTYDSMLDMNEFLMIISAAVLMAIFIEYPFMNLKKILFDKRQQNFIGYYGNKNITKKISKIE